MLSPSTPAATAVDTRRTTAARTPAGAAVAHWQRRGGSPRWRWGEAGTTDRLGDGAGFQSPGRLGGSSNPAGEMGCGSADGKGGHSRGTRHRGRHSVGLWRRFPLSFISWPSRAITFVVRRHNCSSRLFSVESGVLRHAASVLPSPLVCCCLLPVGGSSTLPSLPVSGLPMLPSHPACCLPMLPCHG